MKWLRDSFRWLEDRTGLAAAILPLLRHVIPPKTGWWYVFGSATLFAFILQVVTGTLLTLSYVPSASEAYQTLQFITHEATFGRILRGMHYFGASAMVLFMGIHVARVIVTASYKYPREVNWLSGVALFFLTLIMGFTGQLLRWDQNAVWSVVVGAEQAGRVPWVGHSLAHFVLGGETLGGATLSRFFATHVFFIPGLLFAFIGFHLFLVIRNGISDRPKAGNPVSPKTYRADYEALLKKEGEPFWPNAAWRDLVFGSAVILIILALAVLIGAPELTKPPDPTIVDAQPRPDWYLLWYFAVLALLPHGTESVVIVAAPLLLVLSMVLLPFIFGKGERAPRQRPWALGFVLCAALTIVAFTIAGVRAHWSPHFEAPPLPSSLVVGGTESERAGASLFHAKACEACHQISGSGGYRGPDLTYIGNRLTHEELVVRILNGGPNMPAFASILTPQELNYLVLFLESRKRPPPNER